MQHKFTPTTHLKRAALTLLALIMTCAAAWADNVSTYYIDENGTRHDVTATVVTTYMDYLGTDGETTWYVVNENIFLYGSNNQTYIHGNVNLILADGCELQSAAGSNGPNDGFRGSGNLTLYGQTAGTGTLSCGQEGFMNITGDFTVCSGIVSVSGNRYNAIRAANFTMRGGSVSITNNTNNDCGIGATGTVNIYSGSVVAAGSIGIAAGTVNIYGGSVTARSNGGNAEGSNYGRAIQCSSTFNFYGGNVTAQGDYNWHEGQTRYGIHANSINLSWTSTDDWIYNTKDGNSDNVICYFAGSGGMNIAPYKPFTDGTTTYTSTLTDEQVEALADKTLQPVVPAFAETGDGTPEYPYTIYNATGWGEFCDALQDATYNHFSGKTVKLGADISITQSAGSDDHRFMGTFDGQEHTLDVDITDTGEQGTAPFRFISNATIRNLHVTGTVTGTTHAAGLVGKAIAGTILIENCLVETNVNSTVGNNRHCGGIVGHGFGGNNPVDLTLRNCVYAGTITCDKNYIGGLQGWSDGNTLTLENCLFAGNYQGTATGTAAFHPIALHNTGSATNLTATNVFAAEAPTATNANFIAADGTKTTGRTTAPAGLGTQGATYSFMDMTVYENGLYYNGLYYVAPTLSTDNSGAYLINNEDDWDYFCDALYNNATWNRFSGQTVKLGADISVSRMAGYDNHDFLGTFDGNHDTLTFTATATASYLAPFRNVLGNSTTDRAVIRDLNVVTNITAHDQRHMAGLIALVWGYVDVTNCNVTVNISSTKGSTNTDLYPAGIASQVVKDAQIAVSGCTVDGTISTDGKYAGGIIGIAQGSASITDCVSSVTIDSSTDGDGTHGGFVGVQGNYDGKTITIEGCVFNGQLLGASTHSCGGFLGWRSKTVNISNSLFAPVQVTINTTDGSTPCATFVRNGDSSTTITDCYYTTALGTAQGTQVYSISKGEYVTTLEINGTANPSYTVSGLGFYSTGIKCGDVLYAVANAQLDLTLANNANPPLGYQYDYTVTGGATLNGNTLTMAHDDVTVSVDTESALHSTGQPVSVTYMNADGTTGSHEAIALDETMTNLDESWYFVGKDIAYTSSIDLYGDITIILADGKTMSVGTSEAPIADTAINGCYFTRYAQLDYAFTVYGQSLAESTAGTLSIHAIDEGICFVKSYTQHSGNVSITSVTRSGIRTLNNSITINGGNLDVNANYVALYTYSDVIINGGTVNATGHPGLFSEGNVTFGWTNTSDYIYVNEYQVASGTIAIASGQAFIDDEGNTYNSGTVNASDLNGKTLHPVHGCTQPVQLTATDLTPTSATLNWDGYQDSYNVRYRTDHVVADTLLNEGFEGYDLGLSPEGWTTNGEDWSVCGSSHSGNQSVATNMPDSYLISPELEISDNAMVINFWYSGYGEETLQLDVDYRYTYAPNQWYPLWSSEGEHMQWTEASIPIENVAWYLGSIQLGFKVSGSEYFNVYLDDITVNSYTEYGEWQTINNIAATTTPLTGLTPETPYQWQVQGLDCDGNDGTTEWSAMGSFTTLSYCSAPSGLTATVLTPTSATLNWSGYQDSYNVRYATTTTFISEGFESGVMPDGWSQTSSYWQVTSGTGITSRGSGDDYNNIGAATGNYNAGCFIDSNSGSDILITPAIDLSNVVSATLSFNFWNTKWYSDINTLNVYYRVDEGEWNLLYTNNEKTEGWIPVTVTLEGMAANYQIGFECVSHWSYGMGIDDVVVIDNGVWTTKTNVTSPHTISGLTPETQYQWQVQGLDCDGNDSTTEWSERGSFTTPLHDPVAYINENGEQQLCTEYTVLTGTETTLAAGWYVADSTLNYSQTLILSGDVHLILKDGAVMNVGTTENPVGDGYGITGEEYYSISIYAQSMGDSKGQLHVNAEYHGIYAKEVNICGGEVMTVSVNTNGIFARNGNITIYNGHVTSQGGGFHGILAIGDIIINGGQVTSTGRTYGIWSDGGNLTINGGQVTSNGGTYGIYTRNGNLTLGWTNASDFIYANNYYVNNGTLSIAEGKTFIDEDGNTFESGTVDASDINGKWLYPDCVVFKQVEGYEDGEGGYCLIASPNVDNTDPATINGMILTGDDAADYDLYRFDPTNEGSEWVNYKADTFNLINGHGYLYAFKNTKTLVFTGPFITDTDSVAVDLEYDTTDEHKCWNLVGNPFPCEATINKPYYMLNADGTTINPEAIMGGTIPACTAVFVKGESGDDRVVFSKVSAPASSAPIGAINGLFSVSADKQVYFSQGNLQYQPSTATWRFAPNQYDLLVTPEDLNLYHSAVGNYADVTSLYTENYTDWIDFFGWGTSGWNSGANAYMPYDPSYMSDDFYPGGDYNNDLTGTCANADWAWYNPISNGGNAANQWRTLTHDEWAYLFNTREGAASKYGHGSVDGVNGMIILPDNWTLPDGCSFTPGNSDWTNSYTTTEWAAMEAAGAVFLPAAGQRSFGTYVNNVGNLGRYWSSTHRNITAAYDVWFYSDFISELDTQAYYSNRSMGYSVRPVQDAQ